MDECIITKNKQTGHSRGFGFVTFQLSETIDEVLKHRHAIEGKGVEIKRAENRGGKVPIIPEKKQDRNRASGPGGPRGEKGGFGGSGYGLIYGAFDFSYENSTTAIATAAAATAAATTTTTTTANSTMRDNSQPISDNNNNNNHNSRNVAVVEVCPIQTSNSNKETCKATARLDPRSEKCKKYFFVKGEINIVHTRNVF